MRSWFAVLMTVTSVTACAFLGDSTTTNVTGWSGRDIEESIQGVGPHDASSSRGDLRTYSQSSMVGMRAEYPARWLASRGLARSACPRTT